MMPPPGPPPPPFPFGGRVPGDGKGLNLTDLAGILNCSPVALHGSNGSVPPPPPPMRLPGWILLALDDGQEDSSA